MIVYEAGVEATMYQFLAPANDIVNLAGLSDHTLFAQNVRDPSIVMEVPEWKGKLSKALDPILSSIIIDLNYMTSKKLGMLSIIRVN